MKHFSLFTLLFTYLFISQQVEAQSVSRSDKAVFYNFIVKKCQQGDCKSPYSIQLDNVKCLTGSFKGLNERITPVYEINDFLVSVYDKRSGEKRLETVVANPVEINVEYDGESHNHSHASGSSLQRKVIELESGAMALRLPFSPDECRIEIALISSPDRIVPIATF